MRTLAASMLMLCLHKHSLGACSQMEAMMDPQSFIKTHVDVVVRGLLVREQAKVAKLAADDKCPLTKLRNSIKKKT